MADEDYGDDDAFFFDDDDYLYVEDDYAIADELAETQVPSPGYAGVNDEIANESFEYDVYEYFGELEYGSDSYWDRRTKHLEDARAGDKRKSEDKEDEAQLAKKRRKDGSLDVHDNVLYLPFEARVAPMPPKKRERAQFALLPDWKERFPETSQGGSPTGKAKPMPADMKKAAEAADENDGEDEASVEAAEQMDMEDEDDESAAQGLDEGIVMQVLKQKLADSGLGDVDESVFKDAIAKMLSGDADGEDALGGLTNLLLGQGGGGGEAFQGFLAGQGVQLDKEQGNENDEVEDEDESTNAPKKSTSKATPNKRKSRKASLGTTSAPANTTPSPNSKMKPTRLSAAETTTTTRPKAPSPMVVVSPPPVSTKTSRKRRAPSLDEPSPAQPEAPTAAPKPAAKRRRAPGAETADNEADPEADSAPPAPSAGRTTRSAAAAGKRGR